MTQTDKWGADPNVRAMREIFAAIEESQRDFLSLFDLDNWSSTLARSRAAALDNFNHTWPLAMRNGLAMDPPQASAWYLICLARALDRQGFDASIRLPAMDAGLAKLAGEVFK